ncbi:phage protein [Providencia sp. PROV223]|uniref:phage protein n=1 Tax=Providencia sp. PROV223 TaxID=2949917 RepID=UPI002349AC3F|nr:phage protein [Providencia sp. PROV223]
MSKRVSGQSFDFNLDGSLIHVEKSTLNLTDNTGVAQTNGVPDGWVSGDVSGEGELEFSTKALAILKAKARAAGSWRSIPEVDLMWYAKAGGEEMKVEAFGCKLLLSDILDHDPKGGSTVNLKVKFLVTSPDFVRLDGIPYLESELTDKLIG